MELLNIISNHRLWNRHGLKIVWAIAILFLLLVLTSIGVDALQQNKLRTQNYAPQTIAPIVRRSGHRYQANTIVNANLFGDPKPKPAAVKARKTTLNLKLEGILWASDDTIARAIITSGNKKAGLYSVGESIKGTQASIEEIRDNEVLLNRKGAIESLPLVRKFKTDGIIAYEESQNDQNYEDLFLKVAEMEAQNSQINRSSPKPISPNGEPRKIRKPNFSGLDRALQKMGEI